MARSFNPVTPDYYSSGTVGSNLYFRAYSIWLKPSASISTSVQRLLTTQTNTMTLAHAGLGALQFTINSGSGGTVTTANGALVASTLTHIFAVADDAAGNTKIYQDGSLIATGTFLNGEDQSNGVLISLDVQGWDGTVAEVAAWTNYFYGTDPALAAAVLSKGYSPLFVAPSALFGYWPLLGDNPLVDHGPFGLTLTANGSPAAAEHPRVIYPRRRPVGLPHAVAVASVTNLQVPMRRMVGYYELSG